MEHTEQTKNTTAAIVQWLADLVKWLAIIIVAALAFYLVYPKYYFPAEAVKYHQLKPDRFPLIRGNRITGRVQTYTNGKWTPLGNNTAVITPATTWEQIDQVVGRSVKTQP